MTELEDVKDELETMESKIADAKEGKAGAEGAIKAYKQQLEKDFGLDSAEDAKLYVTEGRKESETEEAEIIEKSEKLREKFPWS